MNKDRVALTSIFTTIAASANENDSSDPPILLALELVTKFIGGELAHAFAVEERENSIRSLPLWYFEDHIKTFERFQHQSMDENFIPLDGMPGRIMKSKAPEWIKDISQDPNFLRNKVARECGLKAAFSFPVLIKNEVVAVLEFFALRAMEPNKELMSWLKPLGIQIGRSIERERSTSALTDSELKFRLIVENINDAFFALDNRFRFTYLNSRAEKYFSKKANDLIGKTLWDIIPVARNTIFQKKYEEAMASQRTVHFETLSPLTQHWVEIHAYPSSQGISVLFQDIHQRKQMEKDLIRSNQNLQQFAYVVSHDLREPLRMISSYSELLMKKFQLYTEHDKDAQKYISYVTDGTERMEKLIESILQYSRVDRAPILKEPTSVLKCLQLVLHDLERLIADGHAEIIIEDLPEVWVTPVHLEQILQNLISNALKFRRPNEKPLIHISKKREGAK